MQQLQENNVQQLQERLIEFMPGFSYLEGTRPGDMLSKNTFQVSLLGVHLNGKQSLISHGFECCYDWSPVINILLEALKNFEDVETFEDEAREYLNDWFKMYAGWGLLSSLLPQKLQLLFTNVLENIKQAWPSQIEFSEERCWELFSKDKVFEEIIPEFEVFITKNERLDENKIIKIRFVNKWNLEVRFNVEKILAKKSLVNVSADAIADMLKNVEQVKDLEIPRTLCQVVVNQIKDLRWRRSHTNGENLLKEED